MTPPAPSRRPRADSAGLTAALWGGLDACRNLIWPVTCAGCGRPDSGLCHACEGAVVGPARFVPLPGLGDLAGGGVWTVSSYQGVPAKVLIAWKERGRHDLAPALGRGVGKALGACLVAAQNRSGQSQVLLVPVPGTRAARRRRGSDLVRDLAQRACLQCAHPAWRGPPPRPLSALRHVRRVRDQAELSVAARRANLHQALAVRPAALRVVAGRDCVIVDDIVTTGATVHEMTRALTESGAHVVGVCCLSVTLRQQGVLDRGYLH